MAWVAVDKNGEEWIYQVKSTRDKSADIWTQTTAWTDICLMPNGSIEKLIGRILTWEDEPVELY